MAGVISAISHSPSPQMMVAPLAGMRKGVAQAAEAAQKIADGDISPTNFVALVEAEVMIKANRVTAMTADSLVGSLFDRKA